MDHPTGIFIFLFQTEPLPSFGPFCIPREIAKIVNCYKIGLGFMAQQNRNSDSNDATESPAKGFLDVFVIRSFRESHLANVFDAIKQIVESHKSPYWGTNARPYRVISTDKEMTCGNWVLDEISKKIANAAISIVILDGMRPNVHYELGYLRALKRPFVVLKHKQWGPSFAEIDSDFSDLKGLVVKEFDHEDTKAFRELLDAEIDRCDQEFVRGLDTHVVRQSDGDNLLDDHSAWKQDSGIAPQWDGNELVMQSPIASERPINRHISQNSLFVVSFELGNDRSKLTAYIQVRFRKADNEIPVWFGYSSRTVAPYGDFRGSTLPVEITIPLSVSGPGKFVLIDNVYKMASKRLSLESAGPLRVTGIRFWGEDGDVRISDVRITA
jgi:hypothetical protein